VFPTSKPSPSTKACTMDRPVPHFHVRWCAKGACGLLRKLPRVYQKFLFWNSTSCARQHHSLIPDPLSIPRWWYPVGSFMNRVYLDFNATTPVEPAVFDAMLPLFLRRICQRRFHPHARPARPRRGRNSPRASRCPDRRPPPGNRLHQRRHRVRQSRHLWRRFFILCLLYFLYFINFASSHHHHGN